MTPYDRWRLAGPPERVTAGTEPGDPCNRAPEPDEDAPRGWRPRPCDGVMMLEPGEDTPICDTCGEIA